ncbi:MAG: HAMP domain-containing protein [Sphingobacteriia bacterium]|nr:HAMP domain-containing protein [Sphingobacteriia bacterium]
MQIKTRLTILFTILVATLLLVFALTIYYTSSKTREEEYFKRLKQQASIKASLLFDSKIAPNVLQTIYKKSNNTLFLEEVAIYDTSFHLLYHDAVDIDKVKETRPLIDSIISLKEINFYIKELQVVGILYEHNGTPYIITAAAIDNFGYAKLSKLKNTLLAAFAIAIVITFFVGLFLARQALQPFAKIVNKVKNITARNLDLRIDEGNRKDEVAALAITFNEMLNRLEESFDAQKQFVSNISHELRTPLTAMLAELQLMAQKTRSIEEYRLANQHLILDTQKLIRLSNSLLDFAKANYDTGQIAFKELRIDEILLDAQKDVLHNQAGHTVKIVFEKEIEEDDYISLKGNEYLLKTAFINLMENGCKFSANHQSSVFISYNDKNTILKFTDEGIGIAEEELQHIFDPFYRGNNKKFVDGNGIGLALTKRIIQIHNGNISVSSVVNKGTTFTVSLPHLFVQSAAF